MSGLSLQLEVERVDSHVACVERELARLKEAHPEVNFYWLELAIQDARNELSELAEECEMMEVGC
ncbi:MAG: hypothetical protein ACLFS4_06770 [Opitutales bacterium]